jgi:hypothetical protein
MTGHAGDCRVMTMGLRRSIHLFGVRRDVGHTFGFAAVVSTGAWRTMNEVSLSRSLGMPAFDPRCDLRSGEEATGGARHPYEGRSQPITVASSLGCQRRPAYQPITTACVTEERRLQVV